MKKWLLIFFILVIIILMFVVFALLGGFGHEVAESMKDTFTGSSIPIPPPLPD